jgi:protein-L-isoaspartate(D-aspartate) O-methyltransferase
VRFVPLLGEEGWAPEAAEPARVRHAPLTGAISEEKLVKRITGAAEPFGSIDTVDLVPLLERVGDARLVLLGEATHGTSEFYRMRERISRELIVKKGFRFIAIEGDWPDAARVDHYVRHLEYPPSEWTAFARFPTWMWRNNEVRDFVNWLTRRVWRFTASISTACTCRFARF